MLQLKRLLRSPAELIERGSQKLYAAGERLLPSVFLQCDFAADEALARSAIGYGPDHIGRLGKLAALHADSVRILEVASEIERGMVPLFGLGPTPVGNPPKWNEEPKAGLVSPMVHWSNIDYLNAALVGDHKILWEFNRHQYFVTLAQAYVISGDHRWPALIAAHLDDWITRNPPAIGVNWASSLEVAYRSISWSWALPLVADAPAFTDSLKERMLGSIVAHATHIERYLSTWFSPNTHLTGEALGLLYIGHVFDSLPRAAHWRALGTRILSEQLHKQVFEDGVYFEQASQYHRYTAEIFLHFLLLSKQRGILLDEVQTSRIERIFDVLMHLTRDDGTIALVGDDDGGLLIPLDTRAPHEVRGLLSTAAAVFSRSDFLFAGCDVRDHAVWLLDPAEFERFDSLDAAASTAQAKYFPNGGICTIRDSWQQGAGHVTIDAGPHGSLSCGHSHADALAVELYAGGGPLFVDSGTYSYVGTARNEFRGTSAHNSLELGGVPIAVPSTSFRWQTRADAVATTFLVSGDTAYFEGFHDGYRRLAIPATHTRRLLHPTKGAWVIEDSIDGAEMQPAILRWHAASDIEATVATRSDRAVEFKLRRNNKEVATALVVSTLPGSAAVVPHWISARYGSRQESHSCVWTTKLNRDEGVVTVVIDWTNLREEVVVVLAGSSEPIELRRPSSPAGGKHTFRWNRFSDMSADNQSRFQWIVDAEGANSRIDAGPDHLSVNGLTAAVTRGDS